MSLEVDKVARLVALIARILCPEEVVEADFEQCGLRAVGGDVAADAGVILVLLVHHRHGVPAQQRFDAALKRTVAGVGHLVMLGDGVLVGRDDLADGGHTGLAGAGAQRGEQSGALLPVLRDDLIKGLNPLQDLRGEVQLDCFVGLRCHGKRPSR